VGSATGLTPPTVEFFVWTADTRIEPASTSVIGSLPSRAVQLCPPVTTASGNGWYLYPPMDFALRWDGQQSEFSLLQANEPTAWVSLAGFHDALLPQSAEIRAALPEQRRGEWDRIHQKWGGQLPFCSADPRAPSIIEILPGLMMRTSPGWSTLVRGVPNWPGGVDHVSVEGIIETEWYLSSIPTMVRLLHQNKIVRFHRRFPLATLQVVPTVGYDRTTLESARTHVGVDSFPDGVWQAYVAKREGRSRQPGDYQRRQRTHTRAQVSGA
jgi:hypothetical protein